MVEFYLNVEDENIKNAMTCLGIKAEELTVKTFEQFGGEDLSQEIQEIRYNHYLNKSEAAVKRIQDFLRDLEEENERRKAKKTPVRFLTIDKIKEKHNIRILKFFEAAKTCRIQEESLLKDKEKAKIHNKLTDEKEQAKKKKENLASRHREKLKSLDLERKMQEELISERLNRSSKTTRYALTSPKLKQSKVFSLTSDEQDIDSRLEKLNSRINKSSENHTKNILDKIESAKKHRKRRNSLSNSEPYDQKLVSISNKHEHAFSNRQKMKNEYLEKVNEKEARFFEKSEKVKKIYEQELQRISRQNKDLVESNGKIEEILSEIKKKQRQLAEKKCEKSKVIEAGIHEKIRKLKQDEKERKEKILEKHFEIERKKKELSQSLENNNKSIREKAMRFTIEKEKTQVIKYLISKSQTPAEVQKLLEKYQSSHLTK